MSTDELQQLKGLILISRLEMVNTLGVVAEKQKVV